jgi:dsDNA-binding SOS-regulon protein
MCDRFRKQNNWEITSMLTEQQRTFCEKAEADDFHRTLKKNWRQERVYEWLCNKNENSTLGRVWSFYAFFAESAQSALKMGRYVSQTARFVPKKLSNFATI